MRKLLPGLVVAALLWAQAAATAEVTGKARALSGNRLEIAGVELQLYGLDAPDPRQACLRAGVRWDCGFAAMAALAFRTAGQWVACTEQEVPPAGPPLVLCHLGGLGGPELNGWMVAAGWGLADRPPLFAAAEAEARMARRGLWSSEFVPPAAWRGGARLPVETAAAPETALCDVKGTIAADGARTYHLPGGAFYPQLGVDPALGERWFCSEAEAEAAGWRRSAR